MIIARIEGATRVLGQSQGYRGLPILDTTLNDDASQPVMVSAWEPTPDEIEKIVAGAKIRLWVLGIAHPPVIIDVADVPVITDDPPSIQEGENHGRDR